MTGFRLAIAVAVAGLVCGVPLLIRAGAQLPAVYVLVALVALAVVRVVVGHTTDLAEGTRRAASEILSELIAVVALVYFVVRPFVLQTSWIPSGSMLPTLVERDRILVDTAVYRYRSPRRGEVVVFHPPRSAAIRTDELAHPQDFVKRLVGLPGERVRTDRDGSVYVNGRPLAERYIEADRRGTYEFPECLVGLRPTHAGEVELTTELGQTFRVEVVPSREKRGRLDAVVPEGHYLVLGDNRDRSDDGHRWGYVPADSTVGRAMAVFWPPQRVGIIR